MYVIPLIKAVQELSAQNEELKKEIDELKQGR
jgi:cell division protein FtsB